MTNQLPEIIITEQDFERLTGLVATLPSSHAVAEQLSVELDRASLVEANKIPADVVTMNSRVRMENAATGEQHDVTLVYPRQADFADGKLSILAPIGAALLGLRAGQSIDWPVPGGRTKTMRVVAVQWQPEAAGEFDM
ncbi:Regulator of nucleoside diphosphate kinase [Enhygromyxa salina]|uniref:Regulator of nucleoside diphosphate kinase n=1 Tax=Enhygromyxa salina TaxID=215803 RepID=A0A2S9YHJ4_9BACT|nr:nucleoside diphosphate kinase regulator [Enhygromyxa salina]PRQ04511.1 Regulator of nucleoside diphosphate kinase [Enhygromyxa salina]